MELPSYLVHRFNQVLNLIKEEKLEDFKSDLIRADRVAATMGGGIISRQIIAIIALPYLKD